ncbi:Fic family protein [Brevundimonas pondensis]|uniref:Fic family protein n=1 Tax=Brevundimonas pondensis TaxID=2774189 RepID=UPI003209A7FA
MFIYDLVGTEDNLPYQNLAAANLGRQYSFLRSVVEASLALNQTVLSIEALKALNYHAIACLHFSAGAFRPCEVKVGDHKPAAHFQVPSLMQMFTNEVNRIWENTDDVLLAAYVLWRLNYIHPFVNGNGRTARAACHLVLCMKLGGWLPGDIILPELLRSNRDEYVAALIHADRSLAEGPVDLAPLHALLTRLLSEQLSSAKLA